MIKLYLIIIARFQSCQPYRVFERVIFDQLNFYLNTNNLYYSSQYGFREKHSTKLAALELVDIAIQELDKGNTPISIFLDLSKAFDTLDHYILKYYGVKDSALRLFESYLSNRKQQVDLIIQHLVRPTF